VRIENIRCIDIDPLVKALQIMNWLNKSIFKVWLDGCLPVSIYASSLQMDD